MFWFQNIYPARGRKLLGIDWVSQPFASFKIFTPQGDGNNPAAAKVARRVRVSKYLPRKGTETLLQYIRLEIPMKVSKYLPRKGTETLVNINCQTQSFVSKYLPRKGTET